MGYVQGDQKEGEKQVTPLAEERKGCTCTNATEEGPNGKHSKDITPKSKSMLLRGGKGAKKRYENLESHLKGKFNKPKNVSDAKL